MSDNLVRPNVYFVRKLHQMQDILSGIINEKMQYHSFISKVEILFLCNFYHVMNLVFMLSSYVISSIMSFSFSA